MKFIADFDPHHLSYLSNLESSQWPLLLSQLLSVACEVVSVVHDDLQAVLVHCSDGWDRTAQITSLAELLMDPFYRTIEVHTHIHVCIYCVP